jgi:hypothetical protein
MIRISFQSPVPFEPGELSTRVRRDVLPAMLREQRADLYSVFLKLGGIGDRMLYDPIGCHVSPFLPN